jgi:radical SAM superfamily enzyme YgiQ (UPF0313 family)
MKKSEKPRVLLVSAPICSKNIPSLALATLQAKLKENNYPVSAYDFGLKYAQKHPIKDFIYTKISYFVTSKTLFFWKFLVPFYKPYVEGMIESITTYNPDIIGFNTHRSNIITSIVLAKEMKRTKPKIKTVFGGPACSFKEFQTIIKNMAKPNYIVKGEGEDELISFLNKKKKPPKLNINNEPCPDYSGLITNDTKTLYYYTTKGCFNKCVFCFETTYFHQFRLKSAIKVFNDLKLLKKKFKISNFYFIDSVTFGSKIQMLKFCDLVIKKKLTINWRARITCDFVDKKVLRKMYQAGCRYVLIGVESGSQKIRDSMKKTGAIKNIEILLNEAKKLGMEAKAMFIVGFPNEGWKEYFETLYFIIRTRKLNYSYFCGMLGILEDTELYDKSEKYGIKNKDSILWYSNKSNILVRLIRKYFFYFTMLIVRKLP